MKKSIIALATAVACLFAFSACSPEDEAQLLNAVNNSGIAESLGSIYLVPSDLQNGTQYVDHFAGITAGDTLWFNSAMCDTTFTYDAYNVYPGVLFVGGNIQTSPNIKNISARQILISQNFYFIFLCQNLINQSRQSFQVSQ